MTVSERVRRCICRAFGHRRWLVIDPDRPLDFTLGCIRCKDPITYTTLVKVDDDPERPGWVLVQRFDRLSGFLEAQR